MYEDQSQETIRSLFKNEGLLDFLLKFEQYLASYNLYTYRGWEDGEVCAGPIVNRYDVEVTLKFDADNAPDPRGALMFERHGTIVKVKNEIENVPISKITDTSQYDTENNRNMKPKMEKKDVILVKFIVPRRILDDADSTEYDLLKQQSMEDDTEGGMQAASPEETQSIVPPQEPTDGEI